MPERAVSTNELGQEVIDGYAAIARATQAVREAASFPLLDYTVNDFVSSRNLTIDTYDNLPPEEQAVLGKEVLTSYFSEELYQDLQADRDRLKLELRRKLRGLAGRSACVQALDGSDLIQVRQRSRDRYAERPYEVVRTVSRAEAKLGVRGSYHTETGGLRLVFPNRFWRERRNALMPVVDGAGNPLIQLEIT